MSSKKPSFSVILISVLGACILFLMFNVNYWVENKIIKQLDVLRKGPAQLSYGTVDVNLFTGRASIADLSLSQKDGKNHYRFSCKHIDVEGLGIGAYLLDKLISFDLLRIDQPHIDYIQLQDPDSSVKAAKKETTSTTNIPNIEIKSLQMAEGTFAIKNEVEHHSNTLTTGQFNISIKKLAADPAVVQQYHYFDASQFDIDFNNINLKTTDSLYQMHVGEVLYRSGDESITVDSFSVKTRFKKYQLAQVVNHETDWLDIYNPSITFTGVDAVKIIQTQVYQADCIKIEGADILLFRDKRVPYPQKPDSKLLHQVIADANINFAIDTIQLKKATLEYQEFVKKGAEPGKLKFEALSASFYNLTNVDSLMEKADFTAWMDAECKVMGQGQLKASFSFPLVAGKPYTVTGNLQEMDLTAFNPMIKHVGFIEIEDGRLLDLNFNFKYNLQQSAGEMQFEYKDFKIKTISKASNDTNSLGQDIKSFVANTFIVNTHNMKKDKKFRVGKISFKRNTKRSIFNYWWKSLLTGFRSSTGIKEEK